MKNISRLFIPFIAIIIFAFVYYGEGDTLYPVDNYPVWMMDSSGNRTDQTSGLYYIGYKNGKKIFISCDDVGAIHRISLDEKNEDPVIKIDSIHFSKEAYEVIKYFRKKDFEEIVFDIKNKTVYLSVEGSEFDEIDPFKYQEVEGIYELAYNKDEFSFDTITSIRKLSLPEDIFEYTLDNISMEGFAVSDNFFFLGLENYQTELNEFTDSTILYVLNRNTNELKKINTRELRIATICGLFAVDDYTLYGVDRNARRAFYIKFNDDHSVRDFKVKDIDLSIPGHKTINMILGTSAESITLDDEGNIYIAVDPWSKFYMPDNRDKKKLSEKEINNFIDKTPILYKFKNIF
jgi:hypothetical protein